MNLAARLEAHTKQAKCSILIDAATRRALAAGAKAEPLGAVEIKGLASPVEVFSIGA